MICAKILRHLVIGSISQFAVRALAPTDIRIAICGGARHGVTASLGAKTGSKQFTKSVSLSGYGPISLSHLQYIACTLPLVIVSCNSKEKLQYYSSGHCCVCCLGVEVAAVAAGGTLTLMLAAARVAGERCNVDHLIDVPLL